MNDIEITLSVDGGSAALELGAPSIVSPTDYNMLTNRPAIEHVELVGDRPLSDFGIEYADSHDIDLLFR